MAPALLVLIASIGVLAWHLARDGDSLAAVGEDDYAGAVFTSMVPMF